MHLTTPLLPLLLLTAAAQALTFPTLDQAKSSVTSLFKRQTACPAVYTALSADLTTSFLGADGMCTDTARVAIRFAFHDAGAFSVSAPFVAPAGGGADGSLILNPDEITRAENAGLSDYRDFLTDKWTSTYKDQGVGAADLIQFAAAHAIRTCPLGPKVTILVGRTDSDALTADGLIPPGFGAAASHDALLALFIDKGFTATDLAALVGAHSSARAFSQPQVPVGSELDSTPGTWDVNFYAQVRTPPTDPTFARLDSDINLANASSTVGAAWTTFVGAQGRWNGAFVRAMARLAVLGIPAADQAAFIDCTATLPVGTTKRDIRAAPINDRIR